MKLKKDKIFDAYLEKIKTASQDKILSCDLFFSLMTPKADLAPEVLLQMGIAVLHDKPIVVIALEGSKISENLKKVARGIEYIKDNSEMKMAYQRLIDKLDKEENH